VAEQLIDTIAAPIRGGFDAAANFAQAKAVDARADWRAITGARAYGSVIAETWSAPGADKPQVEVNTHMQEAAVELARSALHDAQRVLADRTAKRGAYLSSQEQLEGAPSAEQLDANLLAAQRAVASAEERIAALQAKAQAQGGISGPCPHCHEQISYSQGAFHKGGATAAPAEVEELQRLQRELPGQRQAVGAADRAKARVDALRAAQPTVVTELDVANAIAEVQEKEAALREAENVLRDASSDAAEVAEAKKQTADARDAHERAVAWGALEDHLRPGGIPNTLLLRGLTPFNHQLAELAREIRWPVPRLDADFVMRVGPFEYSELSESEQWRVDALVAVAVTVISKLKLLLLDRFDVLDNAGRNELLGWLGVAGKDLFDTVIVAGTLKEKPTVLAERFGVHVLWLPAMGHETIDPTETEEATEENA
jgi:hypothetical protein